MTVAMIVWVAMMSVPPVEASEPPVVADYECTIDPFNPPPEWAPEPGYDWCWFPGDVVA